MLILLNQELIDVGDPVETLLSLGVTDVRTPAAAKLAQLGQDAAYAAGGIENAHPGIKRTLAAFMGMLGEVNCALFVCPPRMRSPRDVAVRFGHAPITTMVYLLSAQECGRLNAGLINQQIWRLADGASAA
ncbi:MAG: hypothetical protein ABUL73_00285 [Alphaproteobacteria bacterium]